MQLYIPSQEEVKVTVLRIVGAVYMSLQADNAAMRGLHWGIHTRQRGSSTTALDPSTASDVSSEDWLMWKTVHSSLLLPERAGGNATQWDVDIRAKRKLDLTTDLAWVGIGPLVWNSMLNLRGLFMVTP